MQQQAPQVGVRFAQAVHKTLDFLAEFPTIGSPYETDDPTLAGIRFKIVRGFRRYVIFYRLSDAGLNAMRIFHGHRDFAKQLSKK